MVEAVRKELETAQRLDTTAGQSALVLAHRIESGAESSSGLAALVRELRQTMAEALLNATVEGDAVDELRNRRESRVSGV